MGAKLKVVQSSSGERYNLDIQIGFRLRVALQQHTDIFFREMKFGITQAQFALMVRLVQFGPSSQNKLGRLAALDSASMVGVISRLKARKLVTTTKDRSDKRRIVVDLTPVGRKMICKAMTLSQRANDHTIATLRPVERRHLIELLSRIAPTEAQ